MLTEEQRGQIKEAIEKRLLEVEKSIVSLEKIKGPIAPDRAIGKVARMDAIYIKSIQEKNLDTALLNRENLNEVLSQIDSDHFGLCTWCKNPIAFERLMAVPENTRCIRCA